jgi:BirA family biotin operon repressor/biotin-[acetyl-CoA-carboxylase] ligase
MTVAHTRWNTEALWQQLEPLLPGLSIEVVARADSTNTQLLERARLHAPRSPEGNSGFGRRAGDTQPCLLVAEHQTGGRGRLGRQWKSAADASLTFSLALVLDRADWSGLSLATGVALAEALDPDADRLRLKWPNDLLLADADGGLRKLGGVLVESIAVGTRRMAVIGVGLNISPHDVGELPGGFACVHEWQPDMTAPLLLAQVTPPLVRAVLDFARGGFAPFVPRYLARDALHARRIEVVPIGPAGIADGVAADGALRVRDDAGRLHLVTSGEVSVRLASV